MAKVLVSTYTNFPDGILDPFRQEFIDTLVKEGNEILLLRSNDFIQDYTKNNCLLSSVDVPALTDRITSFEPDLIFSFNHSGLFHGFHKLIDCPIGIWLVDGPSYIADRDIFKRNADRYNVFSPVRAFEGDLIEEYGMQAKQIHYLPFCSNFENESHIKTQNISFVGTYFYGHHLKDKLQAISRDRSVWARTKSLLQSYLTDRNLPWLRRLQKFRLENIFDNPFDEAAILNVIAINSRIKTLDAVQDLGLTIYGTANWIEVYEYSLDLAMSFDPKPVLLKDDLQSIYNNSEITINISHAQARGGLPWRVFDVMASGSVLVSNEAEDLRNIFGDLAIPTYQTPSEAHFVCQKLLADKPLRETIVASSNEAIRAGHRFQNRITTIGEVLGVNLLPGGTGSCERISNERVEQEKEKIKAKSISLNETNGDSNSNRAELEGEPTIYFSIEAFYSDDLNFNQARSQKKKEIVAIGNPLSVEFNFEGGPEYLRLDIGNYFSHHGSPKVTITATRAEEEKVYQLDLEKDIIEKSQFLYENNEIICGFDPFCVFKNPFRNEHIQLRFESTLLSGL